MARSALDVGCPAMTDLDLAATAPLPLVARTAAVDPLDLPGDLTELLPADGGTAWIRRADGLVAWGELTRVTTAGPERMADAEAAWRELVAHAVVRDEVRLPGTGPVAFGSFAFADDSPAGGVLVVPRVVVGRRGATAWVTTMELGAVPAPVVPTPQPPPTSPGPVTFSDAG